MGHPERVIQGQLGLLVAGDDCAAAVHGGAVGEVPGALPDALAAGPAAPPAGVLEGPLPPPLLAVVHPLGLDSGKKANKDFDNEHHMQQRQF